jgi:nucleolar GTP-binding protein
MRKVKFTQQTIHDKLSEFISDFPALDDIHPFYADLLNVLYDKDHYKLALGQISMARRLVDGICKDFVRLLKFGDSLYRCKQLKRAALGRMVKVLKKNGPSFAYLEEVRQHMARLPGIDPNTRTLLICGYPNVGKSSFMNKITRADVDVQPYAFTTKSLFVGHTDYRYLRWQVIDTPGILDHPLEERNTIEMQSITALAHLRATILYFIDISEQCGYTIDQQIQLCESIKPLFSNKPLVIVMTKVDVIKPEELKDEDLAAIKKLCDGENARLLSMSTLTEEGVSQVKEEACESLLQHRTQIQLKGKHILDIANRMHLAMPIKRDDIERDAVDRPSSIIELNAGDNDRETVAEQRFKEWLKQQELYFNFDPDYKGIDWRERYDLENPEWRFDPVPEILNGHNVIDFYTEDLDEKLIELEKDEIGRLRRVMLEQQQLEAEQLPELTPEQMDKVRRIREKRSQLIQKHRQARGTNHAKLPRHKGHNPEVSMQTLERQLTSMGMVGSEVTERIRERSRSRSRSQSRARSEDSRSRKRDRSRSRSELDSRGLSRSRTVSQSRAFKDDESLTKAERLAKKARRSYSRDGRKGEADRHIFDLKPKHLYSGKRGIGKTDRR